MNNFQRHPFKKYQLFVLFFYICSHFCIGNLGLIVDAAAAAKMNTLMVTEHNKQFNEIASIIENELKSKYNVEKYFLDENAEYKSFEEKVKESKPAVLILINNPAVNLALKYNEKNPAINGVALMGLNLRGLLKGQKNICGISFDIPIYTLVTQFAMLMEKNIKKVLVYSRDSIFSPVTAINESRLKTSGVTLITKNVEKYGKNKTDVEKFLQEEKKKFNTIKNEFDVITILLDSAFLSPDFFKDFWIPLSNEAQVPLIAGVESLVSPQLNFAVFGITPNIADLGLQAVQMITAVINGEKAEDISVEEPLGGNKILNSKKAETLSLKFNQDKLEDVNKL
ncbi:MAG: hypothetical protein HQK51_03775 [Oligoflexia bacterium]|nr:hypothetical protein [Oligoflexia bacterium]